jgi:hypothetical protein
MDVLDMSYRNFGHYAETIIMIMAKIHTTPTLCFDPDRTILL